MKFFGKSAAAAAALILACPAALVPCSSFAFLNRGALVFGTNYDNEFWPGLMFPG